MKCKFINGLVKISSGQLRFLGSTLEDTLHAIVGPIVDDPEPDEEEISD